VIVGTLIEVSIHRGISTEPSGCGPDDPDFFACSASESDALATGIRWFLEIGFAVVWALVWLAGYLVIDFVAAELGEGRKHATTS
jgi:hypothetical protein